MRDRLSIDRRLQKLGKPDEIVHRRLRARIAVRNDDGSFGRNQHPGGLAHGVRIACGLRGCSQARNPEPALFAFIERTFLKLGIRGEEYRPRGLRAGQRIATHRRFGKMLQRHRVIVPLDEVAHGGRAVLHAVEPFDTGPALVDRAGIARKNQHGNAVAVGIVDSHRRMLGANRAVHHRRHRLAGDLRIAMRHADRHFLVQAGQPFRPLVLPIVDEAFLQATKRRTRAGGHVVQIERLAHIDHEVRAGLFGCQSVDFRRVFTLVCSCGCGGR